MRKLFEGFFYFIFLIFDDCPDWLILHFLSAVAWDQSPGLSDSLISVTVCCRPIIAVADSLISELTLDLSRWHSCQLRRTSAGKWAEWQEDGVFFPTP